MQQTPFRTLHHICIVVRDIERSMSFYEGVGVGPWKDFPALSQFEDVQGMTRDDFLELRYRVADIGGIQLQLCQPGAGDTPQRRFLDAHGEGVFHMGFTVDDHREATEQASRFGLSKLISAELPGRGGFTYFDTASTGAGVVLQVRAVRPA